MWNCNPEKTALAALIAVLWPFIEAPTLSRAHAGEMPLVVRVSEIAAPPVSTDRPSESNPCVLLRNDNVLFGVARQLGEFVIVKTGQGGEIKLARQEVLCWADSIRNLYRYRVDRRQQGDLSALVRDARWCIRHDLFDLAAQEVDRIRTVDPRNAEAASLDRQLRSQLAAVSANRVASEAIENPPSDTAHDGASKSIQIVGYDDPDNDPNDESGTVHLPTLRRFASQIQPMLANRCGRCHDTAIHDPEGWTLLLPSAGARASARMTRDNLVSTLNYVDLDSPEQSLLLAKATSAHGDQEAPLDARNTKAIESLRVWLWMTAASMIEPADQNPPRFAAATPIESNSPVHRELSVEPSAATAQRPASTTQDDVDKFRSGPARLPQVDNPFDPDLFNRRFHHDAILKSE